MQKNKRMVILVLAIVMILLFFSINYKKENGKIFIDDIIFFKVFNKLDFLKKEKESNNMFIENNARSVINSGTEKKSENEKYNNEEYSFNVTCINVDFKDINLSNTIKKDTLINGKIAPRNVRRI